MQVHLVNHSANIRIFSLLGNNNGKHFFTPCPMAQRKATQWLPYSVESHEVALATKATRVR